MSLVLVGMVMVLAAAWWFGPRVTMGVELKSVQLPEDLDRYLALSEARFKDLVPGTEKAIVWAGEPGVRTRWSLVYLHGFSATRQETAPLPEQVALALGANLYNARLRGHGRGAQAMLDGSVNAWANDGAEAMAIGQRLGEKILVIGVSTGATLATWLATQQTLPKPDCLVLMSPNFGLTSPSSELLTWPWGAQLATLVIGERYEWQPQSPEHERYWTNRYPSTALVPMMGLVKLTRKAALETIKAPLLVVRSRQDQLVSAKAMDKAFDRFGSITKRLAELDAMEDDNHHVLAGDILAPKGTEILRTLIVDFVSVLDG